MSSAEQNGRREGVGAFSYSNGARYEGSWVADQKHGIGTFKSETGALYEGLFVYDRMAEAPPSLLDDPVRALVDLSTAQQAEVCRHLEAYNGQNLWTQVNACERLAARTIRSVYQTMLRNVCILRRVYGAYRRFAPMPHSDPYVLSCAQFWCLAFDAGLLSPSSPLYETAKLLLSSGSDENFQRARRLSGGTPATLTVIAAERRRSSQSTDIRLAELTKSSADAAADEAADGAADAAADAAPTAAPHATPRETPDAAPDTTEVSAPAVVPAADQQQHSHTPRSPMGVPTSYEHVISHQDKARPPTYETMAEDSLRLHRRPVLFTAFLRALVLLLQIRLRSLRRVADRSRPTGCSGTTGSGDPIESIDLDDPNCLSLAWIALCRKLRIFSETIEKKIQNELKEASQKDEDPPNEQGNQTVSNGTSQQAEASDPVPSGLSNAPSEQSQLKQSAPPQPAARRQDSSSQQLKRSPSGQARPKASISRQQSGVTSTSTRKAPEATRSTGTGPGTTSNTNDSKAKDPSQWRIGTPRESSLRSSDVVEMAACAGRHAEAFRHAALAEKCCTLDEALHRALFASSSQRVGSSKSWSSAASPP